MKNKNNKVTLSHVTLSHVTLSASPTKSFRRGVEVGVEAGVQVGVKAQKKKTDKTSELITRKEAIIKTSKYVAYTALATFIILNPKKAQAQSVPNSPGY